MGERIIPLMPGENEGDCSAAKVGTIPSLSFPEEAGLRSGPRQGFLGQAALCPGRVAAAPSAASPVCAGVCWEEFIIGLVLNHGLDIPRKYRRRRTLGITSATDYLASLLSFS